MLFYVIFRTVHLFFLVLYIAIIARALLSWFRTSARWYWEVMRLAEAITEPFLAPIRSRLPMAGGLDLSPLIALILLDIVENIVFALLNLIFF